jgi:hypothetical protein
MSIPPATDICWTNLVTGISKPDFECFAFKILLGRLGLPVSDPQKIQDAITEIRGFFEKNPNLPTAINDLAKITK